MKFYLTTFSEYLRLFNFNFELRLPNFFTLDILHMKDIFSFDIPITKNKTFSMQLALNDPTYLFFTSASLTLAGRNHAGLWLFLEVLGVFFFVGIEDNHDNESWKKEDDR